MSERGFTLVEVLVALVILAVVLLTAHRAMQHVLDLSSELIQRHVAVWVANDQYALLRLMHRFPREDWHASCENAGYHFDCVFKRAALPDPAFQKVELSVNTLSPKEYTLLHETFILSSS